MKMPKPLAPVGTKALPQVQPDDRIAIAVQGLVKRFGAIAAVDQLEFRVRVGETVALWGANGAGKTTVLRCVLGVIFFEGSIEVLGQDVRLHGKAARRLLGYVPQELGLYGEQTAMETVAFYARLRRVPVARALSLLDTWHLGEAARQPVRSLSGGMKQKLALVIALLADPPVMLLDEPTSSLDVRTRREFAVLLERLKQAGKTLLLCSHRASEVLKLADRVVVLDRGRKVEDGTPEQVRDRLSEQAVLGLTVSPSQKTEAAALLERHGFTVHLNGVQIWVEVGAGRKAEPLRLLAESQIPVLDFELEQGCSGVDAPTPR